MASLFKMFERFGFAAPRQGHRRTKITKQPQARSRVLRLEALEPRALLSWTAMVYMDGDNNLEGAGVMNVNQMETVGSTAGVNILVQFDRIRGYDSTNGNWTDTRRALIDYDKDDSTNNGTMISNFSSIGEVDMGNPKTLTDFIKWGVTTKPATNYLLVVWDHGGGLDGACWDDTSHSHLTVSQIATAIRDAGKHIAVVGFDACMMSMEEVAHQIAGQADVVVASEQTIPYDGWPYYEILSAMKTNMSAEELGTTIVEAYGAAYSSTNGYHYQTLSATRLAKDSALAGALSTFADQAMASKEWNTITNARNAAAFFYDANFRDLGTFLNYVGTNASNGGLKQAAIDAYGAYQSSIITNYHGDSIVGTGLSIYLPAQRGNVRKDYTAANFLFASDTHWDEFLKAYAGSKAAPGPKEASPSMPADRSAMATPSMVFAIDADLSGVRLSATWLLAAPSVGGPAYSHIDNGFLSFNGPSTAYSYTILAAGHPIDTGYSAAGSGDYIGCTRSGEEGSVRAQSSGEFGAVERLDSATVVEDQPAHLSSLNDPDALPDGLPGKRPAGGIRRMFGAREVDALFAEGLERE